MNQENNLACPSCGAKNPYPLGRIPASNLFAGRQLDHVLFGGILWRCSVCCLAFRFPRPSKKELDNLYRQGSLDNWSENDGIRFDWQMTVKILEKFPNVKKVLDVGCFDGRLLGSLDPRYEKLGLEIHADAARRAESRNIRIIAQDFDELDKSPSIADAILAMDVIEHSEDPLKFLAQLTQAASPGGLIIVATGNTSSLSWRLMGSKYWYCHIAEHISFINPAWAHWSARQLDLELIVVKSFSHGDASGGLYKKWREIILNLSYKISPRIFSKIRRLGGGGIDVVHFPELVDVPPYWLSAKDHILVVFKKRGAFSAS